MTAAAIVLTAATAAGFVLLLWAIGRVVTLRYVAHPRSPAPGRLFTDLGHDQVRFVPVCVVKIRDKCPLDIQHVRRADGWQRYARIVRWRRGRPWGDLAEALHPALLPHHRRSGHVSGAGRGSLCQ